MMEQKGNGYQGLGAIEAFDYENTISEINHNQQKWTLCQTTAKYTRDTRDILR